MAKTVISDHFVEADEMTYGDEVFRENIGLGSPMRDGSTPSGPIGNDKRA